MLATREGILLVSTLYFSFMCCWLSVSACTPSGGGCGITLYSLNSFDQLVVKQTPLIIFRRHLDSPLIYELRITIVVGMIVSA